MHCNNCDTRNPDAARFCVICGNPLSEAAAPARAAAQPAYAAPPTYAAPMSTTFGPSLATAGANTTVVQHIYVNQNQPQISITQPGVSLLIRAIWFLFVGLWLGQVWLLVAWLLNLTVIGLPLGIWMINRMPQVMTLRPQAAYVNATQGAISSAPQVNAPPFVVRAVYFVLIGWWLSLLWFMLAWLIGATVIGLPLAFLMFEHSESVTTLG